MPDQWRMFLAKVHQLHLTHELSFLQWLERQGGGRLDLHLSTQQLGQLASQWKEERGARQEQDPLTP